MGINTAPLDELRRKLTAIRDAIFPTMIDVINQHSVVLQEMQQEQLFDGLDGNNINIQPSYAESTIKIKKKKGQPTDRVTLKDSGDFYDSITVFAKPNELVIETSIEYGNLLTTKYGKDILGINQMNLTDFMERFFLPEFTKKVDEIIRQ